MCGTQWLLLLMISECSNLSSGTTEANTPRSSFHLTNFCSLAQINSSLLLVSNLPGKCALFIKLALKKRWKVCLLPKEQDQRSGYAQVSHSHQRQLPIVWVERWFTPPPPPPLLTFNDNFGDNSNSKKEPLQPGLSNELAPRQTQIQKAVTLAPRNLAWLSRRQVFCRLEALVASCEHALYRYICFI